MSAGQQARRAERTAKQAADSGPVKTLGRVGLVAYGSSTCWSPTGPSGSPWAAAPSRQDRRPPDHRRAARGAVLPLGA
ncbi:MAG TPA: hypothetical protein VL330_02095, partial [Actinomycetes bacterium]|nr:hypothetical protein [Actinomycetes bacterium]